MITEFVKNINWVDVALVALFVRMIFVSISTGFVTEFFKLLGVFCALIVSLHYFTHLAALVAKKATLPLDSWKFLILIALVVVVYLAIRFLREGVLILFKVETTVEGFDKYGAGLLGAIRTVLVCSMVIFGLMMIHHPYIRQQTVKSQGYKMIGQAAPGVYRFFYQHVIGKLFEHEKFNDDVFAVVAVNGSNPK